MEISSFSNDILGEILKNVPLRDLLLLGRTNRHWRQVSHNVLSSTRFCLCYRLTNENSQPATLYLEGHHCEVEKSTKIYRLDEFGKSSLISGVERLSIYYPIVLPDFSVGALPNSLFELQSKLLNLKHIEFTGNDVNVFYAPIGRPTLRTMFPQLSQIVVFCNFPEFKLRMEFNRKSGFLPSVKLDCMEKFHTTLVRAFTKVDQFIEAVRAEGLVNQEKFK